MKKFNEVLVLERKNKEISQAELAKELGTTQRRISYLEKGIVEPDVATIIKLADFFGITTDYLLGREEY